MRRTSVALLAALAIGVALTVPATELLVGQVAGRGGTSATGHRRSAGALARCPGRRWTGNEQGNAQRSDRVANGDAVDRWVDKSPHGNHAVQAALEHQPTLHVGSGGPDANTVRFDAARQQFLSAGHDASLNLQPIDGLRRRPGRLRHGQHVAVRQERLGTAVDRLRYCGQPGRIAPLAASGAGTRCSPRAGVQLQHGRSLGQDLGIVEFVYDGQRVRAATSTDSRDRGLVVRAGILANERDLLVGAGPQSVPPCEYLQGEIAEILLYDQALDAVECHRIRQYLSEKYGVSLADDVGVGRGDRRRATADDRRRTPRRKHVR